MIELTDHPRPRISERDIVAAFVDGETVQQLADRFSINAYDIQAVLRQAIGGLSRLVASYSTPSVN